MVSETGGEKLRRSERRETVCVCACEHICALEEGSVPVEHNPIIHG